MLHWHAVWKHVREVTNLEIEKSAIVELIPYIEKKINKVIYQSIKEHEKINEQKKKYGIHQNLRLDKNCVRNAIISINSKEKEKDEKYLQMLNFLSEIK